MRKSKHIKNKTSFHIFRKNDKLNLQNDFIFVDTETKRIQKSKDLFEEKFKLGWVIYWNKETNEKTYVFLKDKKIFYDYVLKIMEKTNHLFIFAHNTDFDIKVLGGIQKFIEKGYKVDSFYINGARFIIRLVKKAKMIEILDTMNYIPSSLKYIGKSIGIEKTKIDFNCCSKKELSDYCKNDCEIIFSFISQLVEFLDKYNLSKLKPTVSSLAFNIFRHKFYDKKNKPIYIHGWTKAIELERMSFRGGISDCLKVGCFSTKLFKLDINSMYPNIMKNKKLPTKLLFYRDNSSCKTNLLMKLYKKYSIDNSKLIIARCKIFLPKEYAYILVKSKIETVTKSMFLSGKFITTLTTPELEYVEKYGKILEIYNISIYEADIIFDKFVNFFYEKRLEFGRLGNLAYKLFCKYILNSFFGKWGQLQTSYNVTEKFDKEKFTSRYVIDGENDERYLEMSLGNRIFEVDETNKNSFDSFVAIPSFITAYSRMDLVYMILLAKRENVYYVDTDCLIVNQIGYNNLSSLIHKTELGKLKLEEISEWSIFYRPKYYIFNEKEKCKGIRRKKEDEKIIKKDFENDDLIRVKQEQFMRFKTSLRNNKSDKQIVKSLIKEMSKKYDKGIILENGDVLPYEYNIR